MIQAKIVSKIRQLFTYSCYYYSSLSHSRLLHHLVGYCYKLPSLPVLIIFSSVLSLDRQLKQLALLDEMSYLFDIYFYKQTDGKFHVTIECSPRNVTVPPSYKLLHLTIQSRDLTLDTTLRD